VWKEGLSIITTSKYLELTNLSITACTEDNSLSFIHLWVNIEILDASRMALEGLGSLSSRNVEDKNLSVGAAGNE
jgi:hypothetical protein